MAENDHNHKRRPIGELSIDARLLYERLIQLEIGERIGYRELSDVIGRNVQKDARGVLMTARRKALNEHRMVFGVIIGEGLQRLNDEQKVNTGESAITHIRRTSRRAAKVITSVDDFDSLPNGAKIRHNAMLSVLGVFTHLSGSRQMKRVEAAVEVQHDKLALQKTLDAFREK